MYKNLVKTAVISASVFVSGFAYGQCDDTNLNAWSVALNPDNFMSVTAGSAMGGTTCGLQLTTGQASTPADNDLAKTYVAHEGTTREMRHRGAFCVNPNGMALPATGQYKKIRILSTQCMGTECAPGGGNVLTMKLQNSGTDAAPNTQVYVWVRKFIDDGADLSVIKQRTEWTYFEIDDNAPSRIEYDLNVATGELKVWVNATAESDTPVFNPTGLNIAHANSPWSGGVRKSRLGFIEKQSNTTPGQTYYIDEAEWRRQTFIGGTCN